MLEFGASVPPRSSPIGFRSRDRGCPQMRNSRKIPILNVSTTLWPL